MTMRISLTLSDRDLRFFRDAVNRAREAVRHADDDEVVDVIRDVIADIRGSGPLPDFISGRLPGLENLIEMLSDAEWDLPQRERERLLATFIYFGDPEDLIPDDIPGIGFLDDVIMIELLMTEMRHVAAAYRDFCAFRDKLDAGGGARAADRQTQIEKRRRALHERMRRRLAADQAGGRKSSIW